MNFSGIIGHERQRRMLERLASSGSIPGAMLFYGMAGSGKKLVAERFAASLFCGGDDPPCLECPSCRQIALGGHPDFIRLSPDAKGNIPIGDAEEPGSVRWLIDRMSRKSLADRYAVIVDGVELISIPGQNALLKTIEEPQHGAVIILISANKSMLLPTILSRCSEISFSPLGEEQLRVILRSTLQECQEEGLVARLSGGSMELALMLAKKDLFAKIVAAAGEIAAFVNNGTPPVLDIASILKEAGQGSFIASLLNIFNDLLHARIAGRDPHPALASCGMDNGENLAKTVKILLALQKGLANNLNIRYVLKGMLYTMDTQDAVGLPAPSL